MSAPSVSVLMITYNQENFIAQAVESVLNQQTTFEYEIVIGDDQSTDKTRAILQAFKRKSPQKIRLILHQKNLKPTQNLMAVYKQCKGKYVALLEGDDYWTSPLKLQRQFDYLEKHRSMAICFHATQMVNRYEQPIQILPLAQFRKTDKLADLIINESFMATCSTMFRNRLFGEFPAWFNNLTYIADLPLNVLNAQHGDIGYLKQMMAVYRSASSDKAFSAQSKLTINTEALKMFAGLNEELDFRYDAVIKDKMARNYFYMAEDFLHSGHYSQSRLAFDNFLKHRQTHNYISPIREKWLYGQLYVCGILYLVLGH